MNLLDEIPIGYPVNKPVFNKNAQYLNNLLKNMDNIELKKVMNLSEKLLLKVRTILNSYTGNYRFY